MRLVRDGLHSGAAQCALVNSTPWLASRSKFGVTDPAQADWLRRRLTPHPLRAYSEPLQLRHPLGNGLRKTYIAVTNPWYPPLAAVRERVRRDGGWEWRELASGHDAMVMAPAALADLLVDCAQPGLVQAV